jgi:hypothetical protein
VTWLLGPEAEGEGSVPARGLAETIEWFDKYVKNAPTRQGQ